MFKKFAIASLLALGTAAAGTMAPTPAEAGNTCKSVYVKVLNRTGGPIKIIDMDYWNPAKGRYESKAVGNKVIPNGQPWTDVRSLQRVNARKSWILIKYREAKSGGFGKWTKVMKQRSGASVCHKGSVYKITLR